MGITDELREYTKRYSVAGSKKDTMLSSIADRIDAEHERAVRYERCAFWHDASDDELANYGLLRAPIDADGVPWYIGDRDEDGDIVMAIKLASDGFWILVGCTYKQAYGARHYHAPTVEDVLREFAERITDSQIPGVHPTYEEAIAKYAKRLTLRAEVDR